MQDIDYVQELERRLAAAEELTVQLAGALESRIAIEQAKGVLAERYGLTVEDAVLLLRASARSARKNIHGLAEEVVRSRDTPQAVLRGMARDSRLRAIALRERVEATTERTTELHARHSEQLDRLAHWTQKPTARVRVDNRSDAVDLASRLSGYRWYLIVPDEEHWDVVVEFAGPPTELPVDLRERIDEWLKARGLPVAHIRLGDNVLELGSLGS